MKYPKLEPEFKKKWIEALRSGEYKQTKNTLKSQLGFCCLGVACAVAGHTEITGEIIWKGRYSGVPKILQGNAHHNKLVQRLTQMNDEGKNFRQIADWIETHL